MNGDNSTVPEPEPDHVAAGARWSPRVEDRVGHAQNCKRVCPGVSTRTGVPRSENPTQRDCRGLWVHRFRLTTPPGLSSPGSLRLKGRRRRGWRTLSRRASRRPPPGLLCVVAGTQPFDNPVVTSLVFVVVLGAAPQPVQFVFTSGSALTTHRAFGANFQRLDVHGVRGVRRFPFPQRGRVPPCGG